MKAISTKEHHNYVAFFLTLACNLNCPYCINLHSLKTNTLHGVRTKMSGAEWVSAANRLVLRKDLPLTLQGGEPTLHKDFYRIVNDVKPDISMDLMTNFMFDVNKFIKKTPVWRFSREAPYASIRVSYHPGQNSINDLIAKTLKMQDAGFRVGLYGIEHPDAALRKEILQAQERCHSLGLDFRLKEFLGEYNGTLYGSFKYDGCVGSGTLSRCECRTTEIIVDPAGHVFRCHADLYRGQNPIAHILDEDFSEVCIEIFRECTNYGNCNPCDVKIKTNRFQVFGHTSVEIRKVVK